MAVIGVVGSLFAAELYGRDSCNRDIAVVVDALVDREEADS